MSETLPHKNVFLEVDSAPDVGLNVFTDSFAEIGAS